MSDEQNLEEQRDELLALEAMYGEEVIEMHSGNRKRFQRIAENVCEIAILVDEKHLLVCEFTIPSDYPSTSPPSIYMNASWIDKKVDAMLNDITSEMKDMFRPGDVVLFEWIEYLLDPQTFAEIQEHLLSLQKDDNDDSMFQKQSYFDRMIEAGFQVFKSEVPMVEKDSKFIAHAAVNIRSLDQINHFMSILLSDKKYERATHSMYAYRFVEPDGTLHENRNDDGENGAGDVLLKLLQQLDVKNVLIVVTRWFHGTLLGPKRFRIISANALQLLQTIPPNLMKGDD